jgi:hypothetical protein
VLTGPDARALAFLGPAGKPSGVCQRPWYILFFRMPPGVFLDAALLRSGIGAAIWTDLTGSGGLL